MAIDGERDTMFPCDCHDDHFLRINWWPGDIDRGLEVEGWLSLGGGFWPTLGRRLRIVWRALTKFHYHTYVGVVLEAGKARAIAAELVAFADAEDAHRAEAAMLRRAKQKNGKAPEADTSGASE